MMNAEEIQRLKGLATEVADREGCVVYDLEFANGGGGQGRTVRLYIDKPDGHVSLDDCTNVARGLNAILDENEEIVPGGAYTLEVSSPGLERPLRQPWHFKQVIGKRVWVKSIESMTPGALRKQVTGELKAADDQQVTISFDGGELTTPYSNVDKAKLVFETSSAGQPQRPKNAKKKKK